MTNKVKYRDNLLIERYEDIIFELDSNLIVPANGSRQKKDNHTFSIDNSGELPPLDWYNARFNVDFKLQQLGGGNVAANDGIVNSSFSLINNLTVKINGVSVYDCSDANQATNIKNLLEYSQGYVKSQGTNEFFYLDMNRNKQEDKTNAGYNSGFAVRRALLSDANVVVNAEIPLNRYGFFEGLEDQLLPNSKISITVDFESDSNLSWKTTNENRVVITKFQLIVPRIIFNTSGNQLYVSTYLKPRKWNYLREEIYSLNSTTQKTGNFRISTGVDKPRHVFVFIINDAQIDNYEHNKFMYDTNNVGGDQKLESCYLEVGYGKKYPETEYAPQTEPTRVFRDVLKYVHVVNEYDIDTLLNRHNFAALFPFIYFDLTKQPTDIRNGLTKLVFKYSLTGVAGANYSIYALVLREQDIETKEMGKKLVLSSM